MELHANDTEPVVDYPLRPLDVRAGRVQAASARSDGELADPGGWRAPTTWVHQREPLVHVVMTVQRDVDAVPDETFRNLARLQQSESPDTAGRVSIATNRANQRPAVARFGCGRSSA